MSEYGYTDPNNMPDPPEGYTIVEFRTPQPDEWFMANSDGEPLLHKDGCLAASGGGRRWIIAPRVANPVCLCGEPASMHFGRTGPCLHLECDCESFTFDVFETKPSRGHVQLPDYVHVDYLETEESLATDKAEMREGCWAEELEEIDSEEAKDIVRNWQAPACYKTWRFRDVETGEVLLTSHDQHGFY